MLLLGSNERWRYAAKEIREIEKSGSLGRFSAQHRQFADALDDDKPLIVQIGGERGGGGEAIEFQIEWKV